MEIEEVREIARVLFIQSIFQTEGEVVDIHEIRDIAQVLSIQSILQFDDIADLIRTIQLASGADDCFRRAICCTKTRCIWKEDCIYEGNYESTGVECVN